MISDKLYIGAGMNLWNDIAADFSPVLNVNLNEIPNKGIGTQLIEVDPYKTSMAMKATWELTPIAGILIKPTPWLSIAYSYRGSWQQHTSVQMVNSLEATLGKYQIAIPAEIAAPIPLKDYYLPWNMTGGIAVRPIPNLLVSFDLTFYHWHGFDLSPLYTAPEDYVRWNDTWEPRIGLEYEFIEDLFGRFGYYYEPSPIPGQYDSTSNFLSMDKNVFSVGLGYSFSKFLFVGQLPLRRPIQVDACFQWQQMNNRVQPKNPDLGQGSFWKISGYQYSVSVGITAGY